VEHTRTDPVTTHNVSEDDMSTMETLVREHRLAQKRAAARAARAAKKAQRDAEKAEWIALVQEAYIENAVRSLHATEAAGFTR
jgi:hypothetical protein